MSGSGQITEQLVGQLAEHVTARLDQKVVHEILLACIKAQLSSTEGRWDGKSLLRQIVEDSTRKAITEEVGRLILEGEFNALIQYHATEELTKILGESFELLPKLTSEIAKSVLERMVRR